MAEFEEVYRRRIAPAIGDAGGCLFAGLLSNPEYPSECISMTLWSSPEAARSYESSGLYAELLREADPYLWRSNEWRIRLSDDLKLEYEQVKEPPTAEVFPVETQSGDTEAITYAAPHMYLRIVSGRVRQGRMDEFVDHYEGVVTPRLLATDGCRYAYLARGFEDSDQVLSVTLWDSQEKAEAYEVHGEFRAIMESVAPFISSVFQWSMSLGVARSGREASSEDVRIEGYQVVVGEAFGGT